MMMFQNSDTKVFSFNDEKLKQLNERAQIKAGTDVFVVNDDVIIGLTDKNKTMEVFIRSVWGRQIELTLNDVPMIVACLIIGKAECDNYISGDSVVDVDNRGYDEVDEDDEDDDDPDVDLTNPHLMPSCKVAVNKECRAVCISNGRPQGLMEINARDVNGVVWALTQLTNYNNL